MAYQPMTPEELKEMVLMGKKRPMNMAYNPGPKDDDLMIIHKRKDASILGRIAKKEGKGKKVLMGTFEIKRKTMVINAEKSIAGASKKLRKYMKNMGFAFKVEILDPESGLVEVADDKVDENAQNLDKLSHVSAQDARRKKLGNRLAALQEPVSELGAAAKPLRKQIQLVVRMLKAGENDKAAKALKKIEDTVLKAMKIKAAKEIGVKDSAPEPSKGEPDRKVLAARAGSLKPVVQDLDGPQAAKIKKAFAEGVKRLKSGDLIGAEAMLSGVENAINAMPQTKPDQDKQQDQNQAKGEDAPKDEAREISPEETQWLALFPTLQKEVVEAAKAKKGDVAGIIRSFNYAKSQAEAGEHASALKAAENTQNLLNAAAEAQEDSRVEEASDVTPDNVVAYRRSRLNWINTRNALQVDLTKLKMAIDAQTRGVEGLEDISNNTAVLLDYLEELDASLEKVLSTLIDTPEGPQRKKLKESAVKIIQDYRKTLDTDFFKAVDNNGFTDTTIRSTALDALNGVETALAA